MPIINTNYQTVANVEEVWDDLCVRFIINLPLEELNSRERVCFQIEEAQWFYEDFVREQLPNLSSLQLRVFLGKLFAHCPLLHNMGISEDAYAEFMNYKKRVPIRGAILLNEDLTKVLLVKGWKQSASWSFPRGKINHHEEDDACAIREVKEETGYDCSELLNSTQYILHEALGNNHMKLYVVRGVPEDYPFKPLSRKEISMIEWVDLEEMPFWPTDNKEKREIKKQYGTGQFSMGRLFMVAPFMAGLKKWVKREKSSKNGGPKYQQTQQHIVAHEETEAEGSAFEKSPEQVKPAAATPHKDLNVDNLKNLLGIGGVMQTEPAALADANARLNSMLSIGSTTPQPAVAPATSGNLLAMLRENSSVTPTPVVDLTEQPFQNQLPPPKVHTPSQQLQNSSRPQFVSAKHHQTQPGNSRTPPTGPKNTPRGRGNGNGNGNGKMPNSPKGRAPKTQEATLVPQPMRILQRPQDPTQTEALLSMFKAVPQPTPETENITASESAKLLAMFKAVPAPVTNGQTPTTVQNRQTPSEQSAPTPYNTVSNDQVISRPPAPIKTMSNGVPLSAEKQALLASFSKGNAGLGLPPLAPPRSASNSFNLTAEKQALLDSFSRAKISTGLPPPTPHNTMDVYPAVRLQPERRTTIKPDSFVPPAPHTQPTTASNPTHTMSLLDILKSAKAPPPAEPPVQAPVEPVRTATPKPANSRGRSRSPMQMQRTLSSKSMQRSPLFSPAMSNGLAEATMSSHIADGPGLAEATMSSQTADGMIANKPADKQTHMASLLATLKHVTPDLKLMEPSPISAISPGTLPAARQPFMSSKPAPSAAFDPQIVPSSTANPATSRAFDRRHLVKSGDAQSLLGLFTAKPTAPKPKPAPAQDINALLNSFQIPNGAAPSRTPLASPSFANAPRLGSVSKPVPSARKKSSINPAVDLNIMEYLDNFVEKFGNGGPGA